MAGYDANILAEAQEAFLANAIARHRELLKSYLPPDERLETLVLFYFSALLARH
jgi:hypothetical protein